MTASQGEPVLAVSIDGKQLALLRSAIFLAALWPFRNDRAKEILGVDLAPYRELDVVVQSEGDRIALAGGVNEPPAEGWTREFVVLRSRLRGTMSLTKPEVKHLVRALRACAAEFGTPSAWKDFYLASPGNVDMYGLSWRDLELLSDDLERRFL